MTFAKQFFPFRLVQIAALRAFLVQRSRCTKILKGHKIPNGHDGSGHITLRSTCRSCSITCFDTFLKVRQCGKTAMNACRLFSCNSKGRDEGQERTGAPRHEGGSSCSWAIITVSISQNANSSVSVSRHRNRQQQAALAALQREIDYLQQQNSSVKLIVCDNRIPSYRKVTNMMMPMK